jgi:hypothetical protein
LRIALTRVENSYQLRWRESSAVNYLEASGVFSARSVPPVEVVVRRRHAVRVCLIVLALAPAVALAACGGARGPTASPSPTASPTTAASSGAPSSWLEKQALWQAMYAGDPHPDSVEWASTNLGRASRLLQSQTVDYKFYSQPAWAKIRVFVVVVRGAFTLHEQGSPLHHATELLLILRAGATGSSTLAADWSTRGYDLSGLGPVHSLAAEPPASRGVWGRTSWAGGPFPGYGATIGHVTVLVCRGRLTLVAAQSAAPAATVVSDADGFFTVDLTPGTYTFLFRRSDYGPSTSTTAAVRPGGAIAVPVVASVP